MDNKKKLINLNLQRFAKLETKATFDPKKVLLSDVKTGELPTEMADIVIDNVTSDSLVSKLGKVENMTELAKKFTYLAEGPGAYWVGEGEKIKVDSAEWLNAELVAHKLGVILPVSKEFLNFTFQNFFDEIRPNIEEALRNKIDMTTFFGGADSPWGAGKSIVEKAKAEGNKIEASADVYNDINHLIALVEDGDHTAQALLTTKSKNADLRGARDTNNLPIFNDARDGVTARALGLPILYGTKKNFDKKAAEYITGDFDFLKYGIPKKIEYSISEEATLSTIKGEDGQPINLWERDLIALKVTMYYAFLVLKDEAFAIVTPKAGQ